MKCLTNVCNFETGICCDSRCAGGCFGPTNRDCVACRRMLQNDECVDSCEMGFYQVRDDFFFERKFIEKFCKMTNAIECYKMNTENFVKIFISLMFDIKVC